MINEEGCWLYTMSIIIVSHAAEKVPSKCELGENGRLRLQWTRLSHGYSGELWWGQWRPTKQGSVVSQQPTMTKPRVSTDTNSSKWRWEPASKRCMQAKVGKWKQGRWTKWEWGLDWKISWSELWPAGPFPIWFLTQNVYAILQSPSSPFSWWKLESSACPLCLRRGIFICYLKVLGEGLYCWWHDPLVNAVQTRASTSS